MEVETTTLWGLLTEPYASLHFPRFALFLSIAFFVEIVVSQRKLNLMCSWSTVATLLLTELAGLIVLYYMLTSVWKGLLIIPLWYYPACFICILVPLLIFSKGVKILWRERFKVNAAFRSSVFFFAIYFAVTTIITPSKLNYIWIKDEPIRIEHSHHFAEVYLFRCRMHNTSPALDVWSDETNKYQSTPEMLRFKERVQYAYLDMNAAIDEAAKKFGVLTTNTNYSTLDDSGFTPEFDRYLETNQKVIDAKNNYYSIKTSFEQEMLSNMIDDYIAHGKEIDIEWMIKDIDELKSRTIE